MTPNASGAVLSPELSALSPRPSWKYKEIAYKVPRNAIELSTMMPLLDRNSRLLSSFRSTIGSGVRNSTNTVTTSSTAPVAIVTSTSAECQPLIGPSETPYIASPRPSPESRNPRKSNRPGCAWRSSRTNSSPNANAAAPIGRFT